MPLTINKSDVTGLRTDAAILGAIDEMSSELAIYIVLGLWIVLNRIAIHDLQKRVQNLEQR